MALEGLSSLVDEHAAQDVVLAAAHDIAERGPRRRPFTREQRRTIERMMRELSNDWRNGRAVQRKQALSFLPMLWREMYELPLHQTPPIRPVGLVEPSYPGHKKFAYLVAESAMVMLMGRPYTREGVENSITSAIHSTLYPIWMYMRASQMGDPSVFQVHDSLVEKLMNTDIGNVRPEDVRLPLPGIYLSLPHGAKILELRNAISGLHEVTMVGIGAGAYDGKRALFCVFWGEPRPDGNDVADDHVYSFRFPLIDGGPDKLKALFDEVDELDREQIASGKLGLAMEEDTLRFYDQSFDFIDGRALLRRFVINFCLYLSSPNLDIEPTKGGQKSWDEYIAAPGAPKRTKVRVKGRRSSKKKDKVRAPKFDVWEVGRNVERLKRRSVATDVLVRGHFRNQAHGPGRTLRKVIWIEPFIRMPTGPDVSPGHEYEVDPNG